MEPSHSYARLECEPALFVSEESHCFRVDETLDYVKDSLEHLSDNDELFDKLFLVESEVLRVHDDDVHDAKEINDSKRTLDLRYEVVTK